ncbi:MAG: DUF4038 domain-containing protein [Chitinophagaceae bacterium]
MLLSFSFAQSAVSFPLSFSSNKKYLVDKNNRPFLIKEFSAWALVQALSEKDEAAFLDSLSRKGFNAVMTSIVSIASGTAGNPPYWKNIAPFNEQWDFSTPNENYFRHVDRFLTMAEAKGFLVLALPLYMGYREDGTQGWWDELLSPKNDTVKMKQYGTFIGNRYKGIPNILWIAGGDHNCDGKFYAYENNMVQGIKSFDTTHLWSGHFDMNLGTVWSSDNQLFKKDMDIDGEYVWTESALLDRGPQYKTELEHYRNNKMTVQLDQSYEHDNPHFADNENYQWIRRKMYDGLLSGCTGTSFGAGDSINRCYTFKHWQSLMNTQGMQQVSYCFDLFAKLPWHKLVPDETNDIITKGRNNFGSRDYICAAKAEDNSCYVLYIPKGQSFEMNVKAISGKPMHINWYNPRTGRNIKIGTAEPRTRYAVDPPSEEDWVLVFYDVSLHIFGTN